MGKDSQLGIHTHLENDGTFNGNLGKTGFYHDTDILTVYGTERAIFNDVEVAVVNNLELFTSLGVKNDFIFMEGKVITPRDEVNVSLDYINYNEHFNTQHNFRHVDGYNSYIGQDEFEFPIGNEDKFRPIILPKQNSSSFFKAAYFYEDPIAASTFADNFDTDQKIYFINNISEYEYWDLNSIQETQVTLTWDEESNIDFITKDLDNLIVTGWNVENERWESLGSTSYSGDLDSGKISSVSFVPDHYEIITFGSISSISNNFNISPNGDEYNQNVVFEELTEFDAGSLKVFNRWGNIVFESADYQNDFEGQSDGRATIYKSNKLPDGTYFYEFKYGNDGNFEHYIKGWIYISR